MSAEAKTLDARSAVMNHKGHKGLNHKEHEGHKEECFRMGVVLVLLVIGSLDMTAQQPTGRGQAPSPAAAPALLL